ncbi:hypothetical protein H2201_006269 [Coniosporium apollinis]|uniref:EKC/KEOPS complex subunit GON7 n=1 Tax=Coniosporium apollinis TaxID=61459 RepID=A0ABQ9NN44_9PEZI|nr:hypothetical protein H2201_006269 [Coniosporium apollinis]
MPNVDLKPIFAKLTAPGETIAALENAATSLKTMLEALRPPKRAPISNEPTDSEEDMLIFDEDVDDYDTEDENFIDEDEDEEVEEVDI